MAGLVDVASLMAGPAGLVEVSELVAEPAKVEGLAGLGVVVALTAPLTCVKLNVGVVGLGVVELVTTSTDFIGGHEVSGGILEDHLWGELYVGVGLGKG